jgi:hypothetical protein
LKIRSASTGDQQTLIEESQSLSVANIEFEIETIRQSMSLLKEMLGNTGSANNEAATEIMKVSSTAEID